MRIIKEETISLLQRLNTSVLSWRRPLYRRRILKEKGFRVTYLDCDENGFIDINQLENVICSQTILISIMMANNEIGTIQNVKQIAKIAHAHNVIFHTDAVQAVGNININVQAMEIDMLSLSAHKFYGPKGVGALYVKEGINFERIQDGGHQERGKRAGTENVAGIVGLGKAIEIASNRIDVYNSKLLNLRNYFIDGLNNNFENIRINGDLVNRLPGNVNVSFRNKDASDILFELDKNCICASGGSACSSGNVSPSHVLLAIGVPSEWINGTVRFTLGEENSKDEIDYVLKCMKAVVI